ncbi:MAG: Crp/Fnr family transcriptional regulator, partial [Traorella sp.]
MEKNILNLLNESEKSKLFYKKISKDEILFNEGDKCHSIGILINGELIISSYTFNGNEIVFNIIKENDIFGNNLIFSTNPFYKGNIRAKKDSLIAFINESLLIDILSSNQLFLKAYLRLQSDNAKSLNDKIKLLSFKNVEERFIYYLYINNNEITFSSVTSLASFLNIERETLSRLISKLV